MKMAMIDACKTLKERKLRAKLVLQVHDELIAECPEEDKIHRHNDADGDQNLDIILKGIRRREPEQKTDKDRECRDEKIKQQDGPGREHFAGEYSPQEIKMCHTLTF